MAKELKFVMLLDCYGELLTEHQRNIMELYYCEDLSLSEISEPLGITRQAVRDLIKRTEQLLAEYEEKLGFADKLTEMRECFNRMNHISNEIDSAEIQKKIQTEINNGLSII